MLLFLNIFQPPVWLTLAVCLLAAAIAYASIHHIDTAVSAPTVSPPIASTTFDRHTATLTAALRALGAMLSRPERGFGRTAAERLLLTVCLLHAVVMTGLFQAQLFHVYTHRTTVANVNTIEQLAASDQRLAIRYRNIVPDVLGAERDAAVVQRLRRKLVYVPAETDVYETVLGTERLADIDRILNYRLLAQQFVRPTGFSSVHVLREYPK